MSILIVELVTAPYSQGLRYTVYTSLSMEILLFIALPLIIVYHDFEPTLTALCESCLCHLIYLPSVFVLAKQEAYQTVLHLNISRELFKLF